MAVYHFLQIQCNIPQITHSILRRIVNTMPRMSVKHAMVKLMLIHTMYVLMQRNIPAKTSHPTCTVHILEIDVSYCHIEIRCCHVVEMYVCLCICICCWIDSRQSESGSVRSTTHTMFKICVDVRMKTSAGAR